jgi:uncharacterized protein YcbK (DUF882 family)
MSEVILPVIIRFTDEGTVEVVKNASGAIGDLKKSAAETDAPLDNLSGGLMQVGTAAKKQMEATDGAAVSTGKLTGAMGSGATAGGTMATSVGALAGVVGGALGAGLTLAVGLLGDMVVRMIEGEKVAAKFGDTIDYQKMSFQDLSKAIDESERAARKQLETSRQTEDRLHREAAQRVVATQGIRDETKALLERALVSAKIARANASGGGEDKPILNYLNGRVANLEALLGANQAAILRAETETRINSIPLSQRRIAAAMDPSVAVEERYKDAVENLNEQRKLGINGMQEQLKYEGELLRLGKERTAELKRIAEEDRKARARPRVVADPNRQTGRTITGGDADRILAGIGANVTSGHRTAERNRQVGGSPNSYHLSNQARDIAKTPGMSVGKIRAAFAAEGVQIKELLDEGDHFHVAWGKAGVAAAAAAKEIRDAAAETRAADQAAAELARTLGQLVGRYDPLRAAADGYADDLADIACLAPRDALLNPGGTGKIGEAYTTKLRLAAAQSQASAARKARGEAEPESTDEFMDRLGRQAQAHLDGIRAQQEADGEHADAMLDASIRAAEAFREAGLDAADAISDLLGRKAGGAFRNIMGLLDGLKTGDFRGAGKVGGILSTLQQMGGSTLNEDGTRSMGKWVAPLRKTLEEGLGKLGTSIEGLSSAMPAIGAGIALNQAVGKMFGSDQYKNGMLLNLLGGPIAVKAFGSSLRGTASISNVDGEVTTRGNSRSRKDTAIGLAGNVQGALAQIAGALGADTGAFAGSIGIRKKQFVVDPTGQGRTKGAGVQKFKTEADAQAALLRDAIADGAVVGLSTAVSRALSSNKDVDKAVREALKVREVEELIEGLGGTMGRAFRDFDKQAADRVRIAQQYGFDVLAIEKRNATDRSKLIEDFLDTRIGTLKSLLDDINFGELFAGSPAEQLEKLRGEALKARTDAEGGVDGAADKLASLSRQILDLSRDAYGTAGGEYAGDRQAVVSNAEKVIQLENERVRNSEAATKETNTHLNEANDQRAEVIARLGSIENLLRGAGSGGSGIEGFAASVARSVNLRPV